MTVAAGLRICLTCGEVIERDPPCETCIGREAGAQARDEWAPAGDVRMAYEDEMVAMAAEGAGL